MPFFEKLAIDHLRTVDGITAIVGDRVSTGKGAPYPRVSVTRIGGGNTPIPAHLASPRLQFDCWGRDVQQRSQPETHALAALVQAAMLDAPNQPHVEGVVTDVVVVLGPVWQPDPQTNRDRYIVDVIVRAHPHPSS